MLAETTDQTVLEVPSSSDTIKLADMMRFFQYLLGLSPLKQHQAESEDSPAVESADQAYMIQVPEDFREPLRELQHMRRSSQIKAGVLLQNLVREIKSSYLEEQIVKELVALEVFRINQSKQQSPKWTFQELLDFVHLLREKLSSLETWGLLSSANELVQNIELFLQTPPAEILHSNYFLVYLLEVQQVLTLQDVQRVISDSVLRLHCVNHSIPETDREFLINMHHGDPSSRAMETFFYDKHQELAEKFKAFTHDDEPLAYLCDFPVILRVMMQDQTRISLHIQGDLDDGGSNFRSVRAWKILESKLRSFFYDVIKINKDLPCNEPSEIKINLYLFKKLVVYLLRTGVLICKEVESFSPPTSIAGFEGFESIIPGISSEIDELPVIDMYIASGATTTTETPIKSPDCAYSLHYKLFYFMHEMRMVMETTRLDQERLVCSQVLDSITQHMKNLTAYTRFFDEAPTNLKLLVQHQPQMKQLFQAFNQDDWAPQLDQMSIPDRFGLFMERLKGPDLAPPLLMKNFALMCQQQLINLQGEVDLDFFNKLFERACSKIALNESVKKMKFQEAMKILFSRVEKVFPPPPQVAGKPQASSTHTPAAALPNVRANNRSIRITQNVGQLLVPTSNKGYLPLRSYGSMGDSEHNHMGLSRSHDPSPAPNDSKTVVIGRGIKPRAATDYSQTTIFTGPQFGAGRPVAGHHPSNTHAQSGNFSSKASR